MLPPAKAAPTAGLLVLILNPLSILPKVASLASVTVAVPMTDVLLVPLGS